MHRPNNDVLEGGPNNIRECAHSADSMDEAVSLSEHATQPPFINGISTRKGSLALFTPPHILTSTLPSWRERVMVWINIYMGGDLAESGRCEAWCSSLTRMGPPSTCGPPEASHADAASSNIFTSETKGLLGSCCFWPRKYRRRTTSHRVNKVSELWHDSTADSELLQYQEGVNSFFLFLRVDHNVYDSA